MPISGVGGFNNRAWANEALGIVGGKSPRKSPGRKVGKARKRRAIRTNRAQVKYIPVTEKHPLKLSREEKLGGAALGFSQRAGIQALGKRVLAAAGSRTIGSLAAGAGRLAVGGLLGGVAMAGVLSYYITSYVLSRKDRQRATIQENAYRAAQAYRAARLKIADDQGRRLTPGQQTQLGRFFQEKLQELGLSKNDLSKLTQGDL